MLKTINISSIDDIPSEWVFNHYLPLPEELTGQDVKISSVFTTNDKTPSMFVFYSSQKSIYLFSDFSTGKKGNSVDLVRELFTLENNWQAIQKIESDFKKHGHYTPKEFVIRERYKLVTYALRNWNNLDAKFWGAYSINSDILSKYNVSPLKSFTLSNGDNTFDVNNVLMYGYFRKDGSLYKVYQPGKDNKFFKAAKYIQGVDQLTFKTSYLIICSSLKDMMAFLRLKINNAEVIAPDSENVIIPERIINVLKERYTKIITLLDNDEAGFRSMQEYKKVYDIDFVHFKYEKDLSDCVKIHGLQSTRELLYPLLKSKVK